MKVDKAGLFFGMTLAIVLVASQIACQQAGGPAVDAMESGAPAGESAASAGGTQSAPPQPRTATLAGGTVLRIRTTSELAERKSGGVGKRGDLGGGRFL